MRSPFSSKYVPLSAALYAVPGLAGDRQPLDLREVAGAGVGAHDLAHHLGGLRGGFGRHDLTCDAEGAVSVIDPSGSTIDFTSLGATYTP